MVNSSVGKGESRQWVSIVGGNERGSVLCQTRKFPRRECRLRSFSNCSLDEKEDVLLMTKLFAVYD